jgi:hypothetical protein
VSKMLLIIAKQFTLFEEKTIDFGKECKARAI